MQQKSKNVFRAGDMKNLISLIKELPEDDERRAEFAILLRSVGLLNIAAGNPKGWPSDFKAEVIDNLNAAEKIVVGS